MKNLYLKTFLASSLLLVVGCVGVANPRPDNSNTLGADAPAVLTPISISVSSHDGNGPAGLFDQDLTTRWSANGDYEWILYDYGSVQEFNAVRASFSKGNEVKSKFDLLASVDGEIWLSVRENQESSGSTIGPERFDFPPVQARYIKYVGHGNSFNDWNNVTEFAAVNCNVNACPSNQVIVQEVTATETK